MKIMNSDMTFMRCSTCGQLIGIIKNTEAPLICCGKEMEPLKARSEESETGEKHVPVYAVKNECLFIQIGSNEHPSTPEHFIEWVAINTNMRHQRIELFPGDDPMLLVPLGKNEKVLEIFAYCNIHGLWKTNDNSELKDFGKHKCK